MAGRLSTAPEGQDAEPKNADPTQKEPLSWWDFIEQGASDSDIIGRVKKAAQSIAQKYTGHNYCLLSLYEPGDSIGPGV